ncbi:MAG: sigma-70 family RNA polymerase sigma factor [Kangiellaceae bacterium]|nr:sigma-70 family RNA polymerase sigma factor [Kangiellaceae bacterium]
MGIQETSRTIDSSNYQGAFSAKLSREEVSRLQSGDLKAFKRCFFEYQNAVFNLSFRISNNFHVAEDITQEVFIEVFNKARTLKHKALIGAWIRRITVNKTLNYLKKSSYRNEKSINEPSLRGSLHGNQEDNSSNSYENYADKHGCSPAMEYEHVDLTQYYLSHLSKKSRLIVWLFVVEGYSHQEIAQLFNKSESFSKSIVSRSFEQLRQIKTKQRICDDAKRTAISKQKLIKMTSKARVKVNYAEEDVFYGESITQ